MMAAVNKYGKKSRCSPVVSCLPVTDKMPNSLSFWSSRQKPARAALRGWTLQAQSLPIRCWANPQTPRPHVCSHLEGRDIPRSFNSTGTFQSRQGHLRAHPSPRPATQKSWHVRAAAAAPPRPHPRQQFAVLVGCCEGHIGPTCRLTCQSMSAIAAVCSPRANCAHS